MSEASNARSRSARPVEMSAAKPYRSSTTDAYKVVSIRLRAAEFQNFSQQASALGLSSNLALRIAARRIGGFLEVDQNLRRQLDQILLSIGEISRNISGLHTAYAESHKIDLEELAAQRTAFGREFARLDASLRSILNVARRRSDGRLMLEVAMEMEARAGSEAKE